MDSRGGQAGPSGTPAAEEWQADYFSTLPELHQLARRLKPHRDISIMRASQLDAGRLDIELTAMLQEQFMKIFSFFQPRLINALQPELSLLLDLLIFRFSVWRGRPTPGSALMNLRYRDERPVSQENRTGDALTGDAQLGGRTGVEGPGLSLWQRSFHGLGTVLARYVWGRLDSLAAAYHWGDLPEGTLGRRGWQIMRRAETYFKVASLVNFLVFLRCGKYRSLLERLLRARLVYQRASMPRALSFEYLNRQLVWHELSELLLFVLPLINVTRLKSFVMAHLPNVTRQPEPATAGTALVEESESQACTLCGASQIDVPYSALPCQHRFCYYCLRSQCEADPGYKCPSCRSHILAMRRWRPPIL